MKETLIQLEIAKLNAFALSVMLRGGALAAANTVRAVAGDSPAYGEDHFASLASILDNEKRKTYDRIKHIMESPTPDLGKANVVGTPRSSQTKAAPRSLGRLDDQGTSYNYL